MGFYGESVDTTSPTFARLTDDDAIMRQAVELCLSTRQGALWSAPEYGRSLREKLLKGLTADEVEGIPPWVASGLEEDERIAHVDVEVTSFLRNSMVLAISVYPKGSSGQPYRFTATVTPDLVTVLLGGLSS